MKKIRPGVFETNSSSSHSLVLDESSNLLDQPFSDAVVASGIVEINAGEYGWEEDSFNSVGEKLSYLYTDAGMNLPDDINPNLYTESDKLNMIRDAIKYHAGLDTHFEEYEGSFPGYIDHQSLGTCDTVWNKGVDGVVKFVFNPESSFETDNDNH